MSPGEYLVVFASGKNKHEDYHFKISRTGEPIVLLAPDGILVDRVDTGEIPVDYALARSPGNPEEWIVVDTPTPGEPNQGVAFTGFTDAVTASPPAGFHERFPSVTLACSNPAAEIYCSRTAIVDAIHGNLQGSAFPRELFSMFAPHFEQPTLYHADVLPPRTEPRPRRSSTERRKFV